MNSKLEKRTGAMFIFLGFYLNIPFSILGAIFDYPHILRQPAGEVLTLFKQGGNTLIATWYAFALTPLMLTALVVLVKKTFAKEEETLQSIAMVFGVAAGLFQVLGLIRWIFVVPTLANAYTDPAASVATKDAVIVVFNAFHQYAGVAVGEHLGQLSTAIWTLLVSVAMFRSATLQRWQSITGIAIAAMMFAGLAEGFATVMQFEPGVFGVLTPVSFILLSIWMIARGVTLIQGSKESRRVAGSLNTAAA